MVDVEAVRPGEVEHFIVNRHIVHEKVVGGHLRVVQGRELVEKVLIECDVGVQVAHPRGLIRSRIISEN